MNKYFSIFLLISLMLLHSCTTQYSPMNTKFPTLTSYMSEMNILTNLDVSVCSGYNCNFITDVKFTESEISGIEDIFAVLEDRSPALERKMIAQAIAEIELITGRIVGTKNDKGGVLENEFIGNKEKQDCVDESASTTSYLLYLSGRGLLRHHKVMVPQTRGALIDGRWPHFSAVILDKTNDNQYVVDSWYRDNGLPPVIMKLDKWIYDWRRAKKVKHEE